MMRGHARKVAVCAVPDGEDAGTSGARSPSKDFGVALGRRLSNDVEAGTGVASSPVVTGADCKWVQNSGMRFCGDFYSAA